MKNLRQLQLSQMNLDSQCIYLRIVTSVQIPIFTRFTRKNLPCNSSLNSRVLFISTNSFILVPFSRLVTRDLARDTRFRRNSKFAPGKPRRPDFFTTRRRHSPHAAPEMWTTVWTTCERLPHFGNIGKYEQPSCLVGIQYRSRARENSYA